jgi:hypothetical protein
VGGGGGGGAMQIAWEHLLFLSNHL